VEGEEPRAPAHDGGGARRDARREPRHVHSCCWEGEGRARMTRRRVVSRVRGEWEEEGGDGDAGSREEGGGGSARRSASRERYAERVVTRTFYVLLVDVEEGARAEGVSFSVVGGVGRGPEERGGGDWEEARTASS
jgi:hypothetical protein